MAKNYIYPADILLPKANFSEWSVIACDQYTSEPEYWQKVSDFVGEKPSALNIILPEVYLAKDNSKRICKINKTMAQYVDSDIFSEYKQSAVYTRRTLKNGKKRDGIVTLIDLEDYSYEKGSTTAIRATEQTVLERIPPRVEIRKDAILEIPHVMLLVDDPDNEIIEPIAKNRDKLTKIYDFPLMCESGYSEGYLLDTAVIETLNAKFGKLIEKSENGLLFAVGDGNHSLATAKECYARGVGPRFALVEIVNIHDSSLDFEPIYRLLKNVDANKVLDVLKANTCENGQKFTAVFGGNEMNISLKPTSTLPVGTLQNILDKFIAENETVVVDYIHGEDSLRKLAYEPDSFGFLFDGMSKSELFTAVSLDGSLPRKTFSMGLADDKRFYLEARKIK